MLLKSRPLIFMLLIELFNKSDNNKKKWSLLQSFKKKQLGKKIQKIFQMHYLEVRKRLGSLIIKTLKLLFR